MVTQEKEKRENNTQPFSLAPREYQLGGQLTDEEERGNRLRKKRDSTQRSGVWEGLGEGGRGIPQRHIASVAYLSTLEFVF